MIVYSVVVYSAALPAAVAYPAASRTVVVQAAEVQVEVLPAAALRAASAVLPVAVSWVASVVLPEVLSAEAVIFPVRTSPAEAVWVAAALTEILNHIQAPP